MKAIKQLLALVLLLAVNLQLHASEDGIIRILAIGNSFSTDAVENYLHQLAEASGKQTIIGNMFIGGCTLERHYNNAQNNAADYSYVKVGLDGVKVSTPNTTLETALKDEKWDYVSLQQSSPLSGQYDTCTPYLADLITYIKGLAPEGVKLVWHQTWAYAANCTNSGFANYNKDQMTMYNAIVNAARQAYTNYGFDILVPSGTAVQNARTTFIGDRMNRDGYHLNVYYGRYTAACTWLEAVLGINPVSNSFVAPNVNESLKLAAQTAAHEACQKPDEITDLSYIQNTTGAKAYFVRSDNDPKAKNDGDGSSWDNAFTLSNFVSHIANGNPGDIYYFAGGTYNPSATITMAEPYTLIGGYDPELTGTTVPELTYPSATPTIFSGDANQSGSFDEGDLAQIISVGLANTLEKEMEMRIQGIDFTGAYNTDKGKEPTIGALHLKDCNNIVAQCCRFYKNKSLGYGGAALRQEYSTSHFMDCEFTDNEADSRGAAIRLSSNSKTKGYATLDRCLIARNTVKDKVGSAILVQHGQRLAIVNSTVYGNKAASGGAIYSNGKNTDFQNEVLIISSTLAGNEGGVQLQLAGTANMKFINSILCGDNFTTTEGDGNILDAYTDVFGTATLENGILKPLANIQVGVPVTTLGDTVNSWNFTVADTSLDQLSNHRTDDSTPGAYAQTVTTGINNTLSSKLSVLGSDIYNLAGQKVTKAYKGIVIENGKKILQK